MYTLKFNPKPAVFLWLTAAVSCLDNSDDLSLYNNESNNPPANIEMKENFISPENSLNPYDSVGISHNELLQDFLDSSAVPEDIREVIELVNSLDVFDSAIDLNSFSSISELNLIQQILDSPEQEFNQILTASLLSNQAKDSILSLLTYLDSHSTDPYQSLHLHIVDFEDQIINDNLPDTYDKKTVLCFTSFVRHNLYFCKKKEEDDDTDWDDSTASRTAALMGALTGPDDTVYWSLILGISHNFL